jgi:hypothetical protein
VNGAGGEIRRMVVALYSLVRLFADTLVDRHQPRAAVQLELMVVRHQLRILQRQVKRPHLRPLTYFSFLIAEQAVS